MATLTISGNASRRIHFTTPDSAGSALCGAAQAEAWTHIADDADYANALAVDCPGASADAPITCGACHQAWRNQHIAGYAAADTIAQTLALLQARFGAEAV